MKLVIVSAEYLRGKNNEIVIKELAVSEANDVKNNCKQTKVHSFLFQPPYAWEELPTLIQRQNLWIVKHAHGIGWRCGHIPYIKLKSLLAGVCTKNKEIFTKGSEQRKFFSQLLNRRIVIDLETLGCPKSYLLPPSDNAFKCAFPSCHRNCAQTNTTRYMRWMCETRNTMYNGW